jgi:cytochrome c oxidase subunit IV
METVTHSPRIYWMNCGVLMLLLGLTWTVGYIDLGLFNVIIALAIAIIKALLVALFFMHIKGSSRLLHLAAAAGVIWLLIMLSLTLTDYFTRGWVPLNH